MNNIHQKFNVVSESLPDKTSEIVTGKKAFTMQSINRLTADWVSDAQSINFDLYNNGLTVMRARGREMAKNDPIVKKFIRLLKKNVIGPDGLTLKVKSYDWIKEKDEVTGGYTTKKVMDVFANRLLQDKFKKWSKKATCTIQADLSFREAMSLAFTSCVIDGESFTMHLKGKEYGGKFGYTTQLIDPRLINERHNKRISPYEKLKIQAEQGGEVGDYIQMGIEYNLFRKVTAYYIAKYNPYDEIFFGGFNIVGDYIRIPASQITHLFVKEFVNQGRGITWFAPAALRLHMMNKATEAAVIAFRIGASKTLVLEQTEDADPNIETAEANAEGGSDSFGNILEPVEPGETYKVPYGYKPHNYDPDYPNNEFGPFTDALLYNVASGFDVDHASLSSNYKNTTWTSSRTALIDVRDGYKISQKWLSESYADDIYENWLYMCLLSDQVPLPPSKYEKFNEPNWFGRPFEYVDPEKEVNAKIKEFKYKFKTMASILAPDAVDLEEHLEEIAEEQRLFEKYGIEFPADVPEDSKPDKSNEEEDDDELTSVAKVPKNGKQKTETIQE